MRAYADRLADVLRPPLAPVFLVSGDEPLQSGESCDAIRAAARDDGFTTREVFEAGSSFDWNQLASEAAALSLFAERKLIDLRIPSGKPGSEGSKALCAYCANPAPDTLLLISLPRLDRTQQNSKWFKAIDDIGVMIQIWPIEPSRLPGWIDQRLRAAGITPTREATQLLADRVEGNLLAARQEIEKLQLLHGEGPLDAETLLDAVVDSARFDVFELVDSALRGQASRCVHVLDGLRGEGTASAVILWALHREIRVLAQISADVAKGLSLDHAISRAKVFSRRTSLVRNALRRLSAPQLLDLLEQCQRTDNSVKGARGLESWHRLEDISLALCGITMPHSESFG